jgi:hypothetical protein
MKKHQLSSSVIGRPIPGDEELSKQFPPPGAEPVTMTDLAVMDGQARLKTERLYLLQHNRGLPIVRQDGKPISRNDKCPCGSGRKFKACHRNDRDYQTVR